MYQNQQVVGFELYLESIYLYIKFNRFYEHKQGEISVGVTDTPQEIQVSAANYLMC